MANEPPKTVPEYAVSPRSINWRGIFAGALVAILTYFILMALGLAIGGGNLQGAIQGEGSAQNLGIGTGIWLVLSILISLFVGGYTSSRVSSDIPVRVGRTQGVVVAALFFGLLFSQIGAAVSSIGRGLGSVVSSVGGAAGDLSRNPQVRQVVENALGDLDLKSPPETVAQGIASRLIRGDTDGAVNYLASESGMSPVEARARLEGIRQDLSDVAADAGTAAAKAMKAAGWTLFGALLLGTLSGFFGGGLGAAANLREPVSRADRKALEGRRAA